MALSCPSSANYFSSIHECIPLTIAALPSFLTSITASVSCSNITVRTVDNLEGLRYCGVVKGELRILLSDLTADYSSLYDIATIEGLCSIVAIDVLGDDVDDVGCRSIGDCEQQHDELECVCALALHQYETHAACL